MSTEFHTFDNVHRLGESATGTFAHFSGVLAALFLVAECSLRPRLPCRAHLRLQAKTVSQARNMLHEFPATPLPERRKNAHSRLSN
ncbi:MAG: hypothetical protein Q7J80_07285 [Anaerolineales bacterium]|nr:hypothetical protein [Anaerolineales bacterium]